MGQRAAARIAAMLIDNKATETHDFYTVVPDKDRSVVGARRLRRGTRRWLGVYANVETFTCEARLAAAVGHNERECGLSKGGVRR